MFDLIDSAILAVTNVLYQPGSGSDDLCIHRYSADLFRNSIDVP